MLKEEEQRRWKNAEGGRTSDCR